MAARSIDFREVKASVAAEFEDVVCGSPVIVDYLLRRGGGFKYRYNPSTKEDSISFSFTIYDCPLIAMPAVDYLNWMIGRLRGAVGFELLDCLELLNGEWVQTKQSVNGDSSTDVYG